VKNAEVLNPNVFTEVSEINFNKFYILKLWLTSVCLVGPILLFGLSVISDPNYFRNTDIFIMFLLFLGFGLVYSSPTFLIASLTFRFLSQKIISSILIKIIVNIIAILGVVITFSILGGSEAFIYSLFYSGSIILCSFFFKIKKRKSLNK